MATRPLADDVHSLLDRTGEEVEIGPIAGGEVEELFTLFGDVVASGDGYPHSPPLTREVFDATWVKPVSVVVVARSGGRIQGAYYLKPNFMGKAAHIANAGYLVRADTRGRGIGRLLVEDSITRAPLLGFDAVQFNLVFASNPARKMYEELGWREIGRIPEAVGGEDAIIYWRRVGTPAIH
ncbi:MAG TPA: GNAT family N-acetyltransferase [Acidimicrobiales bacterium]|nr:GNAT family N-acetyltransferase [Acidimicrobiales bacterium]